MSVWVPRFITLNRLLLPLTAFQWPFVESELRLSLFVSRFLVLLYVWGSKNNKKGLQVWVYGLGYWPWYMGSHR